MNSRNTLIIFSSHIFLYTQLAKSACKNFLTCAIIKLFTIFYPDCGLFVIAHSLCYNLHCIPVIPVDMFDVTLKTTLDISEIIMINVF